MIIRILKIAGVASPKRRLSSLDYLCARSFRLFHNGVNFFFAVYIVADGKLRRATRGFGNVGVISNIIARPNCKTESGLQFKKSDGPMFKLLANNSLGRQALAVAIECKRLF